MMKLLRIGAKGQEKPAILDDAGRYRDLSGVISDLTPKTVSCETLDKIKALDPSGLPELDPGLRTGAVVADTPNFHCVGLNYARHADETGMPRPSEPVLFSKATSALAGPDDDIMIPKGSIKTDWEVELGVIIGREASHVPEDHALDYIAGYTVINDVSERQFQLEQGGQWVKGKSAPGFGPTGPWLVTPDEIPDPQNLRLWLKINDEIQQDSNTDDMIFPVATIISYMSRYMTLRVGDIIATGTPEGVGLGQNPQRYLKSGDIVTLGIEGLGEQRQKFVSA
jgi:2-keto-4-pentenoate hydratase/2-oxohepta-3-ene-1,7-dioic acid hydratase in catechol pathway